MCRPDSASRCAPPLPLNTCTVSRESPLRSPVRNAFSKGAVLSEGKGVLSMKSRSRPPNVDAHRSRKVAVSAPGKASARAQKAPTRRKVGKRRAGRSVRRTKAVSDARTIRRPPERKYGLTGRRKRSVPAATPAVKWTANAPMFSRSAISVKCFAKIGIILLTLQG